MQCYSELIPSTAVTDGLALNFRSADRPSLVVAKTSLLQVFDIQQIDKAPRLHLVGEYELSGTITALRSIHTQDDKDGIESLLISFAEAKVSLVRWDHEQHRISTISIHYYEGDPTPRQPCDTGASYLASILTVDPSSRCVALKFDQRQLAILPFKTGEDVNELDEEMDTDVKMDKSLTNGTTHETPYKKSFVLSLPSLDETLTDVIDLAFLHDYREPTFGILTSTGQASTALWSEGKDILTFHVLTLDLEQGASTILASIPQLPATLWKVKPLPAPFGGTLLLGTNEVIHVAQNGKTVAVLVNEFAEMTGGITASDQTTLDLRLEDCVVEVLDAAAHDVLFALRDGSLAVLHFTMLGPDVKNLKFTPLDASSGGNLLQGLPSCAARLSDDTFFLGSDEVDSVLLKVNTTLASRKRSHAEMTAKAEDDDDEDEDEDDDLYGTTAKKTRASAKSTRSAQKQAASYTFTSSDTLPSLGPMSRPCLARSPACAPGKLEMAAITGRGRASRLAIMTRELRPPTQRSSIVEDAKACWSVRAIKPKRKGQHVPPGPDNYFFVSTGSRTNAYEAPWQSDTDSLELTAVTESEFEAEGDTIEIGTLGTGRWIVHCRRSEIRTYDPELNLGQIIPMKEDESDPDLQIVYSQFCDPYLLVIRNDASLQVLAYDKKTTDVEPLELDASLAKQKCFGASIYNGTFTHNEHALFVLLDDGSLQIFSLPKLKPLFTSPNLSHLPPVLSGDTAQRRVGTRETLTEILVADIGHADLSSAFLILRTSSDEIVLYEPFTANGVVNKAWATNLKFRKVPVPYLPKYDEYLEEGASQRVEPLRKARVGKYAAVIIPGKPPCLLLGESSSRPKILRLQNSDVISVVALQQADEDGTIFATLDKAGALSQCSLQNDISIGTGLSAEKLQLGEDIGQLHHVAYHEPGGMYVVSSSKTVDFLFVEDDTRHPDQDDITSRPQIPQYSLHLFSATTHRIISTHTFPPGEAITCLEVLPLDTSEHTHEVKSVVAVGTALLRGEDMPARGALVILDLLDVIPEPDDLETGVKLHVLSRESVKGAVTAVAPFVGNLIGISQGQKVMVRGMKEDGSCLPVAFMDCLCQLNSLKALWKTGLWLAADSWKGLWFGGFTEDPYKLTFLGKNDTQMEVVCAEFMPVGDQLFILVIDAEMDLHVLQYDPEDPKTVSGAKLLHRASFNTGHWPTSMTLVPSTLAPPSQQAANGHSDDTSALYHVLVTSQSGAVHLITPIDGVTSRRFGNLHGQMVSILEQPAALNPREYRAADGDAAASRGVVDGMLIQRIGELSSARRNEVLGRCGSDAWELRSDLEIINGGGLDWL